MTAATKSKLPAKVYLTGADNFYLMLAHKSKVEKAGHNVLRIVFQFEDETGVKIISEKINQSPIIFWFLNITLVNRTFLSKPHWLYKDKGVKPVIIEHNHDIDKQIPEEILNREISLNDRLIEFDQIKYPSGKVGFVISWHHIIMDGRGSGFLIRHLMRDGFSDSNSILELFPVKENKNGLIHTIKNMYEVRDFVQDSSQAPIETVAEKNTANSSVFKLRTLQFTNEETGRIDANAKNNGARFGSNIFQLAACAHGIHELNKSRGKEGTIWLPIPYDGRKRGGNGPIVTNSISFLFYRLEIKDLKTIKTTVSSINKQMSEQLRMDMPNKYNLLLKMMRHIPIWLYSFLTTYSSRGVVASFLYSSAGEDMRDMNALLLNKATDILVIPPYIYPPGLTFSFLRHNNCLKMNIAYCESSLTNQELQVLENGIKEKLLQENKIETISSDVIVVGAGSAGVAAALAAAETNSVILIEKNDYPGGKATAAEVGTVCGLYYFSKSNESKYVVGGFARKFAEDLARASSTYPASNNLGLHYLPYNIDAYKKLCVTLLHKANIKTFYQTNVKATEIVGSEIKSILVIKNGTEYKINCKAIVDCSGEAKISKLSGLPIIEEKNYQTASQVFTVEGIKEMSETNLIMLLMKELRAAIIDNVADKHFEKVYVLNSSFKNGVASFKLNVPIPVTYAPGNIDELRAEAVKRINFFIHHFQKHVPAFVNAKLKSIAPELGIRVGVRPVGKYILTETDVLNCTKFDNAIANGAWPIEKWGENVKVEMHYFKENDYYQIPAGCLQSKQISNLFFGGRNISATENAIASARVMGTCLQTGFAAGKMAAGYSQNSIESDIIKSIQQMQIFV